MEGIRREFGGFFAASETISSQLCLLATSSLNEIRLDLFFTVTDHCSIVQLLILFLRGKAIFSCYPFYVHFFSLKCLRSSHQACLNTSPCVRVCEWERLMFLSSFIFPRNLHGSLLARTMCGRTEWKWARRTRRQPAFSIVSIPGSSLGRDWNASLSLRFNGQSVKLLTPWCPMLHSLIDDINRALSFF